MVRKVMTSTATAERSRNHFDQQEIAQRKLYISLARTQAEVEEAQRLRYKVFAEEMGAQLSGTGGLDVDGFDRFCDHLIVRESATNQVIGTYRILSPEKANEAGGYYSAGEFDLSRLAHLTDRTVEVGRACVHQNYRNGGTITMLSQLRIYDRLRQYQHVGWWARRGKFISKIKRRIFGTTGVSCIRQEPATYSFAENRYASGLPSPY